MRNPLYVSVILAYFAFDRAAASSPPPSSPSSNNNHHGQYSLRDEPADVEQPKRQRARWLSFPFLMSKNDNNGIKKSNWRRPRLDNIVKDERISAALYSTLTYVQYGLIAYFAVELFNAVKEVGAELGGDSNTSRQKASTRKILLWTKQPKETRGPPPNVSPPWLYPVMYHLLEAQSNMMPGDLGRILSKITKSQATMLQTCLLKTDEKICFENIGGLSSVKQCIDDWVTSRTIQKLSTVAPSDETPYDQFVKQGRNNGIVLWGPPGCGKSLLIQAIARKARLPTLVVTPSLIQSKWFGQSTNNVRDFFGLVSILGPCIVVLDEVDGLFRVRGQEEHETSRDLKTEWLQWWDGVASAQMENNQIIVIAATNRPWDVDPGIWRRLPQRFYVGVPSYDERLGLIELWIKMYQLPSIDINVIEYLAENTEGYTPSDLQQVLQTACRKGPMARQDTELTIEDLQQGISEIPPMRFSMQYIQQLQQFLQPAGSTSTQGTTQYSPNNNEHGWQTPEGDYYHFPIPVDSAFVDALESFLWKEQEWDSSDFDEYEEESEEEDEL